MDHEVREFLIDNGASLSIDLFSEIGLPYGSVVYLPSNYALESIEEEDSTNLKELIQAPTFNKLIREHVNPREFEVDSESIDGVPIIATLIHGGRIYHIIDGVLASDDSDWDQIKSEYNREYGLRGSGGGNSNATSPLTKSGRKHPEPRIPKSEVHMTPQHLQAIESSPAYGHGISNARWHDVSPRRGAERRAVFDKCGEKCFLRPEDLGYPICPRLNGSETDCEVSAQGLAAAKSRGAYLPAEYRGPNGYISQIQKSKGFTSQRK